MYGAAKDCSREYSSVSDLLKGQSMKPLTMMIISSVTFFLLDVSMADVPGIEKGVHIMNGGAYLEVELNAVPTAVDWNNDGAKDLVIG